MCRPSHPEKHPRTYSHEIYVHTHTRRESNSQSEIRGWSNWIKIFLLPPLALFCPSHTDAYEKRMGISISISSSHSHDSSDRRQSLSPVLLASPDPRTASQLQSRNNSGISSASPLSRHLLVMWRLLFHDLAFCLMHEEIEEKRR